MNTLPDALVRYEDELEQAVARDLAHGRAAGSRCASPSSASRRPRSHSASSRRCPAAAPPPSGGRRQRSRSRPARSSTSTCSAARSTPTAASRPGRTRAGSSRTRPTRAARSRPRPTLRRPRPSSSTASSGSTTRRRTRSTRRRRSCRPWSGWPERRPWTRSCGSCPGQRERLRREQEEKQHAQPTEEPFRDEIFRLLRSGGAREDGREAVDGRDAVRLVAADGHTTYLVDAATYAPIRLVTVNGGATTTLEFRVYELLDVAGNGARQPRCTAPRGGGRREPRRLRGGAGEALPARLELRRRAPIRFGGDRRPPRHVPRLSAAGGRRGGDRGGRRDDPLGLADDRAEGGELEQRAAEYSRRSTCSRSRRARRRSTSRCSRSASARATR